MAFKIPLDKLKSLPEGSYYITVNGKIVHDHQSLDSAANYQVIPRVLGGKGGFGSLLRSFRIYRSTNDDMCRDLSGRRLKDVKEEERLRKWIQKKKEREEEKERREKVKYEKLKAGPPKHDFQDTQFNKARDDILDANEDAFEQGLKTLKNGDGPSTSGTVLNASRKRPLEQEPDDNAKKIKGAWGFGMEGDSSSDEEGEKVVEATKIVKEPTISEMKAKQKAKLQSFFKKEEIIEEPIKQPIKPIQTPEIEKKQEKVSEESGKQADVVISEAKEPKPEAAKPKPDPKPILDVDIDLDDYNSEQEMVDLGLDVLKGALHKRGLKVGGSTEERAARLWMVKGMDPKDYPKNILAPKKKK